MSQNNGLITLTRIGDKMPKTKNKNNKKDKLANILSEKKDYVVEGKFIKAIPTQGEKEKIFEFIDEYSSDKNPSVADTRTAKKILQLGKTFYEFGSADSKFTPMFIPHSVYDKLLAAYKKHDIEPESYIPKKLFEKIEIKYSTLSNNLDKAYRMLESEPVPNGVAEKGSVEKFLKDVYDTLGLDKNEEIELMLSPKIDGVSINTGIKDGKFKNPTSRGDKKEGMLIRSLDGYEAYNKKHDTFGIQFEAFVTDKNRKDASIAIGLDKEYATNRTAASAIINRMSRSDSPELAKFLHFYPITSEELNMTYKESLSYIDKFGKVPNNMIDRIFIKGSRKELLDEIRDYYKKVETKRGSLGFAIDGIVVTVVKDKYQDKIGRDGSTNNFQIALKFNPSEVIAIVKDVQLSDGNLGYKTIMIELEEPVEVNGFTYSKIQILSLDQFESLDLYRGDEVKVKQTGDVIPAIIKDAECKYGPREIKLKPSKLCFTCSHELVKDDGRLRCANKNCESIITGRIAHFFKQIGLEGFDRAAAVLLHKELDVKGLKDLFNITEAQLEEIGFDKRAKKLVKGLRTALSEMKDYELLGAIGLDKIQDETSKKILSVIDIDGLDKYSYSDIVTKLKEVRGIDKMAYSYAKSLKDCSDEIKYLLTFVDPKRTDFSNMINIGSTGIEPSDAVRKLIRDLGWSLTKGKKFDILLTSSHKRESKKMEKAKDDKLPIFTETEFIKEYQKDLYK